jgi:hypothetical protein
MTPSYFLTASVVIEADTTDMQKYIRSCRLDTLVRVH